MGVEPWKLRRQKMVEEKGVRKPRRPRSVGLPGWEVRGGDWWERRVLTKTFGKISFWC